MKKVTIYSTTTCQYCKMLKSYLDEQKVEYKNFFVDQDHKAFEEMTKLSDGFTGVPFTTIKSKNGDMIKIAGFDKAKINQVLGL